MIGLVDARLEAYAREHSSRVPELMEELREHTFQHTRMPQMQVGPLEGMLLKLLARSSRAERIVEVGTFTGYSALMMASALPPHGRLITCEIDPANAATARQFFDKSPHGDKIEIKLGPAAESLAALQGPFDMAFIDADKANYIRYFDLTFPMMRPNGLIVVDNVLWSGRVLDENDHSEGTRAIVAFNRYLKEKTDLDKIMMTVRDGMTLIVV